MRAYRSFCALLKSKISKYRKHFDVAAEDGPESFSKALENARAAWLKAMSSHASSSRHVVFPTISLLSERHLQNCTMLSGRDHLISRMKLRARAAELGVEEGKFSKTIMDSCCPEELHLIDLDLSKFDLENRLVDYRKSGRIILHEGDSSKIIGTFPNCYFDFVYIDGDHSYEGVVKDINASVDKINDKGYLVFNDYTFWSPWECIPYGVMQAVNEFCIQNDWEAVYFALGQCMYCDIALRRRQS